MYDLSHCARPPRMRCLRVNHHINCPLPYWRDQLATGPCSKLYAETVLCPKQSSAMKENCWPPRAEAAHLAKRESHKGTRFTDAQDITLDAVSVFVNFMNSFQSSTISQPADCSPVVPTIEHALSVPRVNMLLPMAPDTHVSMAPENHPANQNAPCPLPKFSKQACPPLRLAFLLI